MNLYNGWILLDKPKGISSNDAVQKIKRLLGKNNKVGHAGTLDPLAQGVLPIAVGEATKTVQYLMDEKKEYEFTITWGQARTTADAEGEITFDGGRTPKTEEIQQILSSFLGIITQVPPIYSALKINGKPAYKLARQGVDVAMPERQVQIDSLELFEHNPEQNTSSFRVACSKGTYVRSLAVDIAKSLDTFGYVSFLNRTKVGKFLIKDTIMLAKLIDLVHNDRTILPILPVTYGLGDILAVEVTAEQAKSLRNGLSIFLENTFQTPTSIVQILNDGVLQAIAQIEGNRYKPIRVFNLN